MTTSRIFRRVGRVHFVGIGGIGMCGLAELLHAQGVPVTGSDLSKGPTVERLRDLGIEVHNTHDAAHLGRADVVVYSAAIRATNPELLEADRRKIPVIPRAEMLAELMRLQQGIAVAGTHGKTTTTSLITHILGQVGLDPTAVIGGRVRGWGDPSTTRLGAGEWLVAEADESDGSFLRLAPIYAVITNVDPEHLDHYGSIEALHDAFVEFAAGIPFWGAVVVCVDHPGVQTILPRLARRVITYGRTPQADLMASDIRTDGFGMRFVAQRAGERLGDVFLPLVGQHNVLNALAALAIAHELEVPFADAAAALGSFGGVERRFEVKGRERDVTVVDDYAHHPAELRATLSAARAAHPGRLIAIFQPHRYTRTRDLFDDFASAFHDADVLLVTPIYAAGEDKIQGIDAEALAAAVRAHGHLDVRFCPELEALPAALASELGAGDLVLTLGAGNVNTLGPQLLDALRAAAGSEQGGPLQ